MLACNVQECCYSQTNVAVLNVYLSEVNSHDVQSKWLIMFSVGDELEQTERDELEFVFLSFELSDINKDKQQNANPVSASSVQQKPTGSVESLGH